MSIDLLEIARVAVCEAEGTLQSARGPLQELESFFPRTGRIPGFKITPRHAIELHRYLDAHREKLAEWCGKIMDLISRNEPPAESLVQLLVSRRVEFESALRFVEEAFIKPRRHDGHPQVLEVADWLCVDGFQLFVPKEVMGGSSYPLGPLVALDSRRSPAMWHDDAELSIPSLFDLTARIHRSDSSSTSGLAVFPVITLPAGLSHLPEYYALLSHEVGHAVDAAFHLSTQIVTRLEAAKVRHLEYWKAWMREIVADAAGVTLSGEAFALAWWRFVRPMPPQTDLTYSDRYPPTSLRLSFLREMLARRDRPQPAIPTHLPEESPLQHKYYEQLKADFREQILPLLEEFIFSAVPQHKREEHCARCCALLAIDKKKISWRRKKFRLLPSILTQAITQQPGFETWQHLLRWLEEFRDANKAPGWQTGTSSNWKFSKEFLPTLRPTIVGPDGVTKTPPKVLLLTHRKIAFLGATHKWLSAALKETAPFREEPWETIDLYFASDPLLEAVEYYDKQGMRRPVKNVQEERDRSLSELRDFFTSHPAYCRQVRFYFFDGPPVFASYWDWDQPGGRIHISPQLAGIDISKCPAIDYLWLQDIPTYTYDQYRTYLRTIHARARLVQDSE